MSEKNVPAGDAQMKVAKSATKAGKTKSPKPHYNKGKTPPKPIELKDHSPFWVPWVGIGLIVIAVGLIVANYILKGLPPFGNLWLPIGFVIMTLGLIVLSRWK